MFTLPQDLEHRKTWPFRSPVNFHLPSLSPTSFPMWPYVTFWFAFLDSFLSTWFFQIYDDDRLRFFVYFADCIWWEIVTCSIHFLDRNFLSPWNPSVVMCDRSWDPDPNSFDLLTEVLLLVTLIPITYVTTNLGQYVSYVRRPTSEERMNSLFHVIIVTHDRLSTIVLKYTSVFKSYHLNSICRRLFKNLALPSYFWYMASFFFLTYSYHVKAWRLKSQFLRVQSLYFPKRVAISNQVTYLLMIVSMDDTKSDRMNSIIPYQS